MLDILANEGAKSFKDIRLSIAMQKRNPLALEVRSVFSSTGGEMSEISARTSIPRREHTMSFSAAVLFRTRNLAYTLLSLALITPPVSAEDLLLTM